MNVVSSFESRLLRILQAVLHRAPAASVRALVLESCPEPNCLGRPAVQLIQDMLARGTVQWLAKQGGWRRERYLRAAVVVEGRLWERTPPGELGLKFSRHALGFLNWLTAAKLDRPQKVWQPPEAELTSADRLLHFLAFDVLEPVKVAPFLAVCPAFARNALCRLAYPEHFLRAAADPLPDFHLWTEGPGAIILETLQSRLRARLLAVERLKGDLESWQQMQAMGRAQERTLEAFLRSVEQAGRLDLARFVLEAAAEVLIDGVRPERWISRLTSAGPRLADRSDTHRAALALAYQLPRLRDWARNARAIGYFDDGYPASQLWLADWERCAGDILCTRAEMVIRQLDPMKQT